MVQIANCEFPVRPEGQPELDMVAAAKLAGMARWQMLAMFGFPGVPFVNDSPPPFL